MSLKINVIYKGIIYRIKGIKVLCSVVWTVIILLAAIIGMGVWMIINVYDNSATTSLSFVEGSATSNILNDSNLPDNEAPFIDFGKSDDTNPSGIPIFNMKLKDSELEEATTRKSAPPKPTTLNALPPKPTTLHALPPKSTTEFAPNPDYNVYDDDPYDYESYEHYESEDDGLETETDIKPENSEFIPSERLSETDKRTPLKINNKDGFIPIDTKAKHISTNIQSDAIDRSNVYQEYSPYYELNYPSLERPAMKIPPKITRNEWRPKNEMVSTYIRPPPKKSVETIQFSRRTGTPDRKSLIYRGPPVVGYGLNPYEKLTMERIEEYDQFWETYAEKKANFIFRVNETKKVNMRPHLRGLRPTGSEYDLPIRPDAQLPEREIIRQRPNTVKLMPPREDPNRKLMIPPSTTERPIIHVLNPLQELYDYSKKLAASLLSFNTKSPEEIRDSSQKLAEYGANLIESHNQIFNNISRGPLDRIVALIPNAEKLRSMDPFELSLITWTFLDFWEFLIEKVGTLSDEDLVLLQERIESLRKRKDNAMTQAIVNETLTRYTPGDQRSISKESMNVQDIFSRGKEESENVKSPINYKIQKDSEHILVDLFPSINKQYPAEESNSTMSENSELTFEDEIKRSKDEHTVRENYSSQNFKVMPKETKISFKDETHHPERELISNSDNISSGSSPENTSLINDTPIQKEAKNSVNTESSPFIEEPSLLQSTIMKLVKHLKPMTDERSTETNSNNTSSLMVEGRSATWDPLGLFTSESRMQFMQFAVKVLFNFGKVYLKKPYALDCTMLLFCKDLNRASRNEGMEAVAAKLKGVGLKVLTESDKQLRETDTFSEVWRSVTAWTPLQCDVMFPRCDGPKALEIVNEVALGGN